MSTRKPNLLELSDEELADRIYAMVVETPSGEMRKSDIHFKFSSRVSAARIDRALAVIVAQGRGVVQTVRGLGHPSTVVNIHTLRDDRGMSAA